MSRALAVRSARLPFFFFTLPPATDSSPLSLHDALPICKVEPATRVPRFMDVPRSVFGLSSAVSARQVLLFVPLDPVGIELDRKSTRLNSSHLGISYAVFCLKKKITKNTIASPHHDNNAV